MKIYTNDIHIGLSKIVVKFNPKNTTLRNFGSPFFTWPASNPYCSTRKRWLYHIVKGPLLLDTNDLEVKLIKQLGWSPNSP